MLNRLFARGKVEMPALEVGVESRAAATNHVRDADQIKEAEAESLGFFKVAPPAVAVISAKGGAGATTVAVNLSAAFSLMRVSTTIIDGHLQHPGVGNLLGVEPAHSIIELFTRVGEVDRKLFEACACDIGHPYLKLLSPPLSGEAALQTDLTELSRCFELVRHYSEVWVLDLPQNLDRHLVTLTDVCSQIVLVFEATVSGVAACQRWLKVFRDLGYDKERVICVLNRSGSKFKGVEEQLDDDFFGQPIYRLPNASAPIWDCANKAVPLVFDNSSHAYSRAVIKLAEQIWQTVSSRSDHV